jgi:hypothetical protein
MAKTQQLTIHMCCRKGCPSPSMMGPRIMSQGCGYRMSYSLHQWEMLLLLI